MKFFSSTYHKLANGINTHDVETIKKQSNLGSAFAIPMGYTLSALARLGDILQIDRPDTFLDWKLLKMTYRNGDFEEYSYDLLDRPTKIVYNGSVNTGDELFALLRSAGRQVLEC